MNLLLRTAAQARPWLGLLWHGAAFVKHELAHPRKLPLRRRLQLLRRGFWSESFALCALDENDHTDYVSDWAHIYRCAYLNGPHWLLLEDKLWWNRAMQPFAASVPQVFGTLSAGRFQPLTAGEVRDAAPPDDRPLPWLDGLLERHGALVLKPVRGGQGRGVHVLRRDGARYTWDGQARSPGALRSIVARLRDYLVMAFVDQHPYAAEIFPHSGNTLRILTMIDPDTGQPFIARAVHRIGTSTSIPTDNVSRGGMSSAIALEGGELGPAAVTKTRQLRLTWHDRHPETASPIAGVVVPNWKRAQELVLAAAQHLAFCPYIGWDLLVTEGQPGVAFIEANDTSWTHVFQIHGGLLRDPRVRRFYEHHGVV